jgi:enoyl-CoA hydratase/carnithine racemase
VSNRISADTRHISFASLVQDNNLASGSASSDTARSIIALREYLTEFQNAIGTPEHCPFPVIAACHGHVVGLGVDIISACDIRYAASNTSFSIKVSLILVVLGCAKQTSMERKLMLAWQQILAR